LSKVFVNINYAAAHKKIIVFAESILSKEK